MTEENFCNKCELHNKRTNSNKPTTYIGLLCPECNPKKSANVDEFLKITEKKVKKLTK
jgi:hypothetical protein